MLSASARSKGIPVASVSSGFGGTPVETSGIWQIGGIPYPPYIYIIGTSKSATLTYSKTFVEAGGAEVTVEISPTATASGGGTGPVEVSVSTSAKVEGLFVRFSGPGVYKKPSDGKYYTAIGCPVTASLVKEGSSGGSPNSGNGSSSTYAWSAGGSCFPFSSFVFNNTSSVMNPWVPGTNTSTSFVYRKSGSDDLTCQYAESGVSTDVIGSIVVQAPAREDMTASGAKFIGAVMAWNRAENGPPLNAISLTAEDQPSRNGVRYWTKLLDPPVIGLLGVGDSAVCNIQLVTLGYAISDATGSLSLGNLVNGVKGLDKLAPYVSTTAGAVLTFQDTPSIQPTDTLLSVTLAGDFELYLMYKPSVTGSQMVSTDKCSWSMNGTLSRSSTAVPFPTTKYPGTRADYSANSWHPIWSLNVNP